MFTFKRKKEKQFHFFTHSMHSAIMIGADTLFIETKDNFSKRGIRDAASQKERVSWMLKEGERKEFARLHHFLSALSESGRAEYIDSLEPDQHRLGKAKVVHYYLKRLPAEGIAAYDFAWASYLSGTRWENGGYIRKEEARQFKLQAVRQAQQAYNSWSEFITGYIAGYQFMTAQTSLDHLRQNDWNFSRSFVSKHGSLSKSNWHTDFSNFS
ncbi:DUF1266 domain-containing protein [Brevibacillus porteri]|uniref:DUF1266 domain-containing protein n=1 Tax=Brevibacillus porteri TaxID=2126350 RepID=A0ABX5FN32_9BACL|nr:DUF1266 domain-containing protein [Brevibacillus porteri]MED1799909.1 DUF1266 domain-containing protein [Brevibacillus porteri]MED2132933.1 DUF1266 domain-containing protein [Brevibacillus porteri]MED2744154.1 DUF1266 domain-containing protein [Brevibacillus porteri]MED2816806.1 DUF1266 domain-containing protein [Brevibacillus porteri]MED2894380.1 DUF1266 domain-containing protein [Brevibacillus porteri]